MRKIVSFFILLAFTASCIMPPHGFAQAVTSVGLMTPPGQGVPLSEAYTPAHLKGMVIDPKNPFKFDFIIDRGQDGLANSQQQDEYQKLIKYFLAALAIPDTDQWVNLSPYEKDRIIPDDFGLTEMGRDLLAQDYLLKQLTASLTNPDNDLGKKFWARVYEEAYQKFGTTDVPTDTFNKVWIVPDRAVVYEKTSGPPGGSINSPASGPPGGGVVVYVLENHLKVMMESDYVAMSNQKDMAQSPQGAESRAPARDVAQSRHSEARSAEEPPTLSGNKPNNAGGPSSAFGWTQDDVSSIFSTQDISKKILREVIVPAIEREVNEGKNFAPVRQVYSGMLLATWYKRALKESILGRLYADKAKVKGIEQDNPAKNQEIYAQYVAAFKTGVFNMIREDVDKYSQETIPRKYFSGGMESYGRTQLREGTPGEFDNAMRSTSVSSLVLAAVLLMTPEARADVEMGGEISTNNFQKGNLKGLKAQILRARDEQEKATGQPALTWKVPFANTNLPTAGTNLSVIDNSKADLDQFLSFGKERYYVERMKDPGLSQSERDTDALLLYSDFRNFASFQERKDLPRMIKVRDALVGLLDTLSLSTDARSAVQKKLRGIAFSDLPQGFVIDGRDYVSPVFTNSRGNRSVYATSRLGVWFIKELSGSDIKTRELLPAEETSIPAPVRAEAEGFFKARKPDAAMVHSAEAGLRSQIGIGAEGNTVVIRDSSPEAWDRFESAKIRLAVKVLETGFRGEYPKLPVLAEITGPSNSAYAQDIYVSPTGRYVLIFWQSGPAWLWVGGKGKKEKLSVIDGLNGWNTYSRGDDWNADETLMVLHLERGTPTKDEVFVLNVVNGEVTKIPLNQEMELSSVRFAESSLDKNVLGVNYIDTNGTPRMHYFNAVSGKEIDDIRSFSSVFRSVTAMKNDGEVWIVDKKVRFNVLCNLVKGTLRIVTQDNGGSILASFNLEKEDEKVSHPSILKAARAIQSRMDLDWDGKKVDPHGNYQENLRPILQSLIDGMVQSGEMPQQGIIVRDSAMATPDAAMKDSLDFRRLIQEHPEELLTVLTGRDAAMTNYQMKSGATFLQAMVVAAALFSMPQDKLVQSISTDVYRQMTGERMTDRIDRLEAILQFIKNQNSAVMDDFEKANPDKGLDGIAINLAKDVHSAWLTLERKNKKYVEYTKDVHAFLLEMIKRGVLPKDRKGQVLTEATFLDPRKKYQIVPDTFKWEAIENVDERMAAQKELSALVQGKTAFIINSMFGEMTDLMNLFSQSPETFAARGLFFYGLQRDSEGATLKTLFESKTVLEALEKGTLDQRMKAIVELLRRINVGWRLNNTWNTINDYMLAKPFALVEDGGIGIEDIVKDAVALKAILEKLNSAILTGTVVLPDGVALRLRNAFDNGLAEALDASVDPERLAKAVKDNPVTDTFSFAEVDKLVQEPTPITQVALDALILEFKKNFPEEYAFPEIDWTKRPADIVKDLRSWVDNQLRAEPARITDRDVAIKRAALEAVSTVADKIEKPDAAMTDSQRNKLIESLVRYREEFLANQRKLTADYSEELERKTIEAARKHNEIVARVGKPFTPINIERELGHSVLSTTSVGVEELSAMLKKVQDFFQTDHFIQPVLRKALSLMKASKFEEAWSSLAKAQELAVDAYNVHGLSQMGTPPTLEASIKMLLNGKAEALQRKLDEVEAPLRMYYEPVSIIEQVRAQLARKSEEQGTRPVIQANEREILMEAADIARRYGGPRDRYDPDDIADLERMIQGEYSHGGMLTPAVRAHIKKVMSKLDVVGGKPELKSSELLTDEMKAELNAPKNEHDRIMFDAIGRVKNALQMDGKRWYTYVRFEKRDDLKLDNPNLIYDIARIGLAGNERMVSSRELVNRLNSLFGERVVKFMLQLVDISKPHILMSGAGIHAVFSDLEFGEGFSQAGSAESFSKTAQEQIQKAKLDAGIAISRKDFKKAREIATQLGRELAKAEVNQKGIDEVLDLLNLIGTMEKEQASGAIAKPKPADSADSGKDLDHAMVTLGNTNKDVVPEDIATDVVDFLLRWSERTAPNGKRYLDALNNVDRVGEADGTGFAVLMKSPWKKIGFEDMLGELGELIRRVREKDAVLREQGGAIFVFTVIKAAIKASENGAEFVFPLVPDADKKILISAKAGEGRDALFKRMRRYRQLSGKQDIYGAISGREFVIGSDMTIRFSDPKDQSPRQAEGVQVLRDNDYFHIFQTHPEIFRSSLSSSEVKRLLAAHQEGDPYAMKELLQLSPENYEALESAVNRLSATFLNASVEQIADFIRDAIMIMKTKGYAQMPFLSYFFGDPVVGAAEVFPLIVGIVEKRGVGLGNRDKFFAEITELQRSGGSVVVGRLIVQGRQPVSWEPKVEPLTGLDVDLIKQDVEPIISLTSREAESAETVYAAAESKLRRHVRDVIAKRHGLEWVLKDAINPREEFFIAEAQLNKWTEQIFERVNIIVRDAQSFSFNVFFDSAMAATGLTDAELPRIVEMEIVRNDFLKDPEKFPEYAKSQNDAYTDARGQSRSGKPLTEKEIYRNMAGVFATLEGLAWIAERDGRKLREVARDVIEGKIDENNDDLLLMARMAHATWLSTQFDDNFATKRFLRPIVMPAQELTPEQLADDFVQIRAAAKTIYDRIGEVVAEELATDTIKDLQGRVDDLIAQIKAQRDLPAKEEERIRKTALTVFYAHREQKRKQGTPYAEHQPGVAELAVQNWRLTGTLYITGALLHDTREDQIEFFENFRNFARNMMRRDKTDAGRQKLEQFNGVLLMVRLLSKLEAGERWQGAEDELLAKYFEIMVNPKETYKPFAGAETAYYNDEFIRAVQIIKLSDILYNAGDLRALFDIIDMQSAKSAENIQSASAKVAKAFRKIFDYALPILVMKSKHLSTADVEIFFGELEKILKNYQALESQGEKYVPLARQATEALQKLEAFKGEFSAKPDSAIKGGIDFNASNLDLQIKRDGNGVPLPVSQQNLDGIRIDGLVPVILEIRPASRLPLFSEAASAAPSSV